MPKVIIHNLGPIRDCSMEIEHFTILTGAQASGKSTVAKCVYFCRTIKDDIYDLILKRELLGNNNTLFNDVLKVLRNKFLQIFGTSLAMDKHMALTYYYSEETYVKVSLRLQEGNHYISPNYVWIDFSNDISEFLRSPIKVQDIQKEELKHKINLLFDDDFDSVFIPAGRSLITLLTSQLNYLDVYKRQVLICRISPTMWMCCTQRPLIRWGWMGT